MRPQNLVKQQPGAIALPASDDRLDQELAEWFARRGGAWAGTAAELLAAVKTRVGAGNDLWPQSPRALYAHVESHRRKLHALGVDVLLHHRYPRMVSLCSCQDEKQARKPPSGNFGNNPASDSPTSLPTLAEHQRPIPAGSAALRRAAMAKLALMGARPIQSPLDNAPPPRRVDERDSQEAELQLMGGPAAKLLYDGYGVVENPFGVTPNPRFLYQSETHAEARSSLIIGIEYGVGFQALIAPPGMGKTTILFNVLERFKDVARTALLFQVQGGSCDFLRYLLSELGSETHDSNLASLQGAVNQLLTRERLAGRPTIIIVDEAQSLDTSVLETLRLLSNFETATHKLVHIILAGQPRLAERLASPELAQLYQRISILTTLTPFGLEDTRNYIDHRLRVAGYRGRQLFTFSALKLIWGHSCGIPRQINKLCFNALLLAKAAGQKQIDSDILHEVVQDFDLDRVWLKTETTANSGEILQSGNGLRLINEATGQPRQTSDETIQSAVPGADHASPRSAGLDNTEPARVETSRVEIVPNEVVPNRDEKEVSEIIFPHATLESGDAIFGDHGETTLDKVGTSADSSDAVEPMPEASAAEPDLIAAAKSEDQSCPNLDSARDLEPNLKFEQSSALESALAYDSKSEVEPESSVETGPATGSGAKSKLGLHLGADVDAQLQSETKLPSRLHTESDWEARARAGVRWYAESHLLRQSKPDSSAEAGGAASEADLKPNLAPEESGLGPMPNQWHVHKTEIYLGTSILILLLVLWNGGAPLSPKSELTSFQETLGLSQPTPSRVYDSNPDTQVWVDVQSGLYYCPGSKLYSRTPGGRFKTQRSARLERFTAANRELCQ